MRLSQAKLAIEEVQNGANARQIKTVPLCLFLHHRSHGKNSNREIMAGT